MFYIPTWADTYSTYTKGPAEYKEGNQYVGRFPTMAFPALATGPGSINQRLPEEGYGAIQAFDPQTGQRKWEFKMADVTDSGVLSTASGVVFGGDNEGNFMAFDSRSGRNLWHYQTGSSIWGGAPMTYLLDGRQYVVIPSGSTLTAFALPGNDVSSAKRP